MKTAEQILEALRENAAVDDKTSNAIYLLAQLLYVMKYPREVVPDD